MSQKSLVLIVIDGLTPAVFERAVENGDAPALAFLAQNGTYRAPLDVPVAHPGLRLVDRHRGASRRPPHPPPRLVRPGGAAARRVRLVARRGRRGRDAPLVLDTIYNMNARHLSPEAVTVFEALDDAGLGTAAVNFTCYRGRTEHRATLPGVTRTVLGPRRFFFYNLFESDATGAPLSVRRRSAGTIDEYAAAVGRWLVTRDGFDFFLYYLSDYDYASHSLGPRGRPPSSPTPTGGRALFDAAGGPDEFLDRYAVHPLLRPRPDAGRTGGAAGGRVRGPQHLPPQRLRPARRGDLRLEPRRPGLPDAALRRDPAQPGRAARRPAGGRRRAVPRGRRGGRTQGRRGVAVPAGR